MAAEDYFSCAQLIHLEQLRDGLHVPPPNDTTKETPVGFAQPTLTDSTTNALFFGPSGAGKTTAAGTACNDLENPDLAVLNTEGGGWQSIAHGLGYTPLVWDVTSKSDLIEAWKVLEAGDHGIKTLVIDSVTDLAKLLLDEIVATTRRRRPAPDVPCMEDYNELSVAFDKMLRRFRDLNLNVIMVALEKDEIEMYEEGGKEKRRVIGTLPEVPGKLAKRLPALVDVSIYCQAMEVRQSEQYPTGMRYVGQTVPKKGRPCKVRGAQLPALIDLHWRHIAEAYGRDEGLPLADVPAIPEETETMTTPAPDVETPAPAEVPAPVEPPAPEPEKPDVAPAPKGKKAAVKPPSVQLAEAAEQLAPAGAEA